MKNTQGSSVGRALVDSLARWISRVHEYTCQRSDFRDVPLRPIRPFDIRWNEPLGLPECPYMRRYMLNLKWFSIRLHIWYRSDDKRYMHNHAFNFLGIVLKGKYYDVTESSYTPEALYGKVVSVLDHEEITPFKPYYRKASHTHYVGNPDHGTITLLFCGPKVQNWGFKVNGKIMRPLRFFSRYGHPSCGEK